MGKWFQDKSFSAKKWGQGGTNARKIHRDINARKLHRALGVLLAAALIFQTLPFDGIAVSASESSGGGLCTHHRSHTQDCGYKEAEAGHTCTHEHTEDCYRIVEGEDGSTTKELDCHHEHDESCGYRESAEGSPCTFVCEICNEGTDGTPEDNTDGNGINDGESENPGIENENEVKEPDAGQEECICEELCTEDNGNNGCRINTDCPVCGAEGASLSDCKGKDTEDSTEDTEENTDQPEDTDLCKHHREHDDTCGYLPESEDSGGSPCTYECRICPIEKLIAALPDAADITEDNEEEVRAQLEEILALYRELNEDEQGQIDLSRCYELQEKLDAANIPDPVEEGTPDLELFGQKVCSGDSGDGWSYADGVLTLADYHSDNSGEVFVHITNADLEFTLYLKGDNSVKTSEKLIYGNAFGSTTITGDQGASLSLDGKSWSDRYIFIRGVNMDVTMQEMIFLAYDMEIDNATVNFNMNGSNGYIYTTHGGFTIKNGSDVTITNSSGAVDYCVATNKAVITDSALKVTNPSGFGVYVTNISTQVSEYKAFITNSTISADVSNAAIHCEDEMAVTNSQVTGIGRFLLRSKKAITVDDSSMMEGITYELFKSDTGATYQVYGSHTPAANLTVAEKDSFVIPEGAVLTIPDGIIIENNGTMRIHEKDSLTGTGVLTGNGKFLIDVNEDMISVPEGLVYTGKDYTDQIILEENATVCGVEFTADMEGWTRNIEPAVVKEAGEYTVTFTKGDKEIRKTFTVVQSGTQFVGDGVVQTYKGSVVCGDFTADDTITVKATPTATGEAPAKAASRLQFDPVAGEMAVYVGDTQVSIPAGVGADGSYTMTVSAADVLEQGNVEPNGAPITLTAKFVGNDNMADGAGTVDVSISAVAKIENGSTTTYVGNLDDAFKTENDGATITMLNDVELAGNESIRSSCSCTLDLNGHTIRQSAVTLYTFSIGSGTVTIKDSGTGGKIESSNITVSVIGGTLSIESGTVSGFYGVEISGGTVNISGGVISGEERGLWVHNSGKAVLSGGTLIGGKAVSINADASVTLKNLLAEGYAYHRNNLPVTKAEGMVDSNTWGEVSLDTKATLTGTVTVKKCNHTGEGVCEYTPNEGAETHAMTCLACGYAGAAESCAYSDDYGHDETNHWQTCTLCGGKKTEAHGWVHQCTSATGIIRRSCDKCEIETVVGTVSITPDFSVTYGKTGSATLVCTAELADGYSLEPADSADNCWVLMALSDGKSWNLGRELEVKLPADLPAGEYWYDAYPRLSYQGNNTIVKRFNVIGKVTVTPAPLTIKANDQTITYGGSIATGTDQVTPAGLVGGDTLESVTLEASSDQVAVADKTITPSAAVIKRGGEDVTANYNITYQPGTLTINRAQGTLTVPAGPVAKTFGDGQFLLGCSTNGDGKISYASSDENVASVSADGNVLIKGAGEAVITVSLADGTNYTGAESQEVRITVAKAAAPAIPGETRNYTYLNGSHGAVTIDVAGKLPKDRGETTYTAATTDGKGILSGVSMDQDGNLVYTVEANKAIGDTAVITVTAVMANYGDTAYAVTIELVEKKTVEPQDGGSVSVKDGCILTYGQTLSDLTLENVIFVEQGTQKQVEGTLAWSDPSHVPEVADRTAQWVFTPKDNEEYEQLTGTATITVVKATPDTEAPEAAAVTYHPAGTLDSVGLNGGGAAWTVGGSAVTVEGTWGWKEPSAIPAVKNSGYTAVFTPKDTANYDTVERTVAVTVAKAEPYIATPPTAAQITYGDALDASVLTGGTVQYSSSDGTAVTGSFAWKDGSIKPDSGSAAYTVVFTPADSTDYSSVETQVTLVTGKAENAPDMPPSAMNVARRFEKVGDVGLPEGWQWQDTDRDTALEIGVPVTATAVYTGADRDNYRNVTVSVAITRADCDHEHTEIRNAVTATCQRKGYTGDTWCLNCGELLAKGTETDLADHSGGTATCIRGKVCQVCGTEYTGKDSANHMHTEIRGAIKAGCTSDGYTGDTYCTDCGAKTGSGRAVPAAGHDWHVTREEAATTTSEGRRIYTCGECGQTREESIPKLPQPSHTHSYSPRETKAATCTENGVVTYSCSCGDSYTQNTAALGHSYRSEVTKQPTVSAEGVMTYTCGRCGHSYTRPIAKLPDTGTQQPGTQQPGDTEPGSGSTEETRPDTGIPFIKDEDGKTGWNVIRAEEEKAQEGSTINVDMNGTTVVPGDIFDSIKGRDITVTFDMGGGILWSVNGKEVITDKAGDIDFSVKTETNAIPVDIVNNVTGERYSIQISLAHEGEFGFTAVLSIGLGKENAGYTASLYYYNESTGELEFICSDEVAEDGTVSLAFTHASDYVIAIDGEQEEESGNATEPEQPDTPDKDSTGQAEESPQTGQAWRPWWIIVVGALVVIMGIGVFFVVKKGKDGDSGQV